MSSAERFLSGFAQTWRDEQKRVWDESSHTQRTAHVAALEHAWRLACQQWWNNLRHVIPASLVNPLDAALRQSELCMSLALRGEQISATDLALMVNPVVGLHAAMQTQHQHDTTRTSAAEHTQLLATQAMIACIARIAQSALTAAREQLRDDQERTPREIHAHCAHIMEDLYRQQAGHDEFVQLIGHWVNAHVGVIAARRDAKTQSKDNSSANAAGTSQEHTGRSCFERSDDPLHLPADTSSAISPVARTDPRSDRIAQQLREFSDKLAAGATSLRELPCVSSCGVSPFDIVFRCDGVTLRRYRGAAQEVSSGSKSTLPPLLVVYSLVNRPYILDLNEDRSFVRALCDAGRDVYLIDWGYPREQDTTLGLDDYINRYLHGCVTFLQAISDAGTVDLIGICQGGPFALCYAALQPARVRRLALMAAPIDFHADDFLLSRWMRHIDVDVLVNTLGNVPGHLLNWSFIALKPVSLSAMKALQLLDLLDCPRELATYAQMEHWLQDNPDQAGKAFAEFTQTFVRNNALVNATARIGTTVVDLSAVHHRVLNLYATRDHIVPPSASRALAKLLPSAQCTNREVHCGHISMFAGRRAQSKVPKLVNEWFERPD